MFWPQVQHKLDHLLWSQFVFVSFQKLTSPRTMRDAWNTAFSRLSDFSQRWYIFKFVKINRCLFIYKYIWFLFLHHVSCTLYRPGVIFSLRIVSTCREIWLVWCHFLRIFEPLKILKVIFGVNYLFICTLIYILCSLINLRIAYLDPLSMFLINWFSSYF